MKLIFYKLTSNYIVFFLLFLILPVLVFITYSKGCVLSYIYKRISVEILRLYSVNTHYDLLTL